MVTFHPNGNSATSDHARSLWLVTGKTESKDLSVRSSSASQRTASRFGFQLDHEPGVNANRRTNQTEEIHHQTLENTMMLASNLIKQSARGVSRNVPKVFATRSLTLSDTLSGKVRHW